MSVAVKYKGNIIASASSEDIKTLQTAGKYCDADIVVENIPDVSALPLQLVLIGTETVELLETTSTTVESVTTNINVGSTDYLFGIVTIECNGAAEGDKDWGGRTFSIFYRHKTNGVLMVGVNSAQIGTLGVKTLSYNAYKTSTSGGIVNVNTYGVYVGNAANVTFNRKCHASNCPKIMGGLYTVKAYGIVGV